MGDFVVVEKTMFDNPQELLLVDGRHFRVFGIQRIYSRLTKSRFWSAIAEWRLGGKWMPQIPLNAKVAIDLAEYFVSVS